MRLPILALLSVLMLGPGLAAQAPAIPAEQLARMDAKLRREFPDDQPGAVVQLSVDGRVVFQKAYGLADLHARASLSPDMAFHIGSITKQFTAAAIMKLVEAGKVDLKAPVARYLEGLPEIWKAVSIERLLTHTSGLPFLRDSVSLAAAIRSGAGPQELLRQYAAELPLRFPPGTRYEYSNEGYVVLGLVIEKASGQDYRGFIHKSFLEPLGLRHTGFETGEVEGARLPTGYVGGQTPAPVSRERVWDAADGLVSTAEDLTRWTLALHGGEAVTYSSLARMLVPVRLEDGHERSCGFGLDFGRYYGHYLIGHDGLVSGFRCWLEADPTTRAVAVLLVNSSETAVNGYYFAGRLLALAAGDPIPEPATIAIDPAQLRRLTGYYKLNDDLRVVTLRSGRLFIRRAGKAGVELLPVSGTEFVLQDSDNRVRFELEGETVLGLHTRYMDGPEDPLRTRAQGVEEPE